MTTSAPRALLDHARAEGLQREQHAGRVDREHAIPGGVVELEHGDVAADRRRWRRRCRRRPCASQHGVERRLGLALREVTSWRTARASWPVDAQPRAERLGGVAGRCRRRRRERPARRACARSRRRSRQRRPRRTQPSRRAASPCQTTGVAARTAYEKIWDDHALGSDLLYVDLHLVHEVTSPQAFEGLRLAGRTVRRPDRTIATADHNVPTWDFSRPIEDDIARQQLEALARNVEEFGIPYYGLGHRRQGIVHVIGPELGITQPGMTIVCGDSHTSTHGAFGALAFGIGTSEVEHVLATQTLPQKRAPHAARDVHRRARARRRRQGPDPRPDRAGDLRGCDEPRRGVRRRGHPRALDGRPHDGLQHVDRVGRARRADRARRDDVPLPRGPAGRAGADRAGHRALVALRQRRRRDVRPRGRRRRRARSRRSSPGARTPARRRRSPAVVPDARPTRTSSARSTTWG